MTQPTLSPEAEARFDQEDFRIPFTEEWSEVKLKAHIALEKSITRRETVDQVKNLFDEFNEMEDNAIRFEFRICKRLVEFFRRLEALATPPEALKTEEADGTQA